MTRKSVRISGLLRRCLILLLAYTLAFTSTQFSIAYAQQAGQDFEAPLIEHEQIESGALGETQVFSANVVDNVELKTVTLFYRFSGEEEFQQIEMQPIAASTFYSANIATDQLPDLDTAIEYYLQAADLVGNTVLKGYVFDPLIRQLVAASSSDEALTNVSAGEPAADERAAEPVPKKKSRTLYYVLGALALVALAALAGGGSSGSGDTGSGVTPPPDPGSDPGCGSGGCQINLVVTPP